MRKSHYRYFRYLACNLIWPSPLVSFYVHWSTSLMCFLFQPTACSSHSLYQNVQWISKTVSAKTCLCLSQQTTRTTAFRKSGPLPIGFTWYIGHHFQTLSHFDTLSAYESVYFQFFFQILFIQWCRMDFPTSRQQTLQRRMIVGAHQMRLCNY